MNQQNQQNQQSDTPKRFEDWYKVDCNECARYWDSSCDGATGSHKPCNSFLATRNILIPQEIKTLKNSLKTLKIHCYVLTGVLFGVLLYLIWECL